MRTDFAQSLDVDRPHTLLTQDTKHSGSLEYRYDDTGETACVPNIWYNQTGLVRAQAVRWEATKELERAAHMEKYPPHDMTTAMVKNICQRKRERAARINAEADRMVAAIIPTHPGAAARLKLDYGPLAG